jgi:hypothetical protein
MGHKTNNATNLCTTTTFNFITVHTAQVDEKVTLSPRRDNERSTM